MSDAKYLGLTANKLAKIASELEAENAKLRQTLKDLVVGIGKELCDNADKQRCSECSMDHANSCCVVTDAMDMLGPSMLYGDMFSTDGLTKGKEDA